MNTALFVFTRPFARLIASALLLSIGLDGFATPLAAAECEVPEQPSAPPSGEYKGYFRLICEMRLPSSPPLVIPMKFEGDLVFRLGRPELNDPTPPASTSTQKRRPLRPPAPTQNQAPDPAAVDAVREAAVVEAALDAALAKADTGYLYIPPGDNPRVEGVSNVSMGASIQQTVANGQWTGQVGTKRTMPFDIRGEESTRTGKFDELTLWGTQDQAAFAGSFDATGKGTRATGALDFGNTGATGRVTAQDSRGKTLTRDVSVSTGGSGGSPPKEDKYQRERRKFDEAYDRLFGKPQNKIKMLTLTVTSTSCWLLRGTVRADQFEENLKRQGAALVVKESEWMATLEEREPDFEKRVQSLAAEPTPTPITWAYIDSFGERWKALRQEAQSEYRRCVAKELVSKFVAIQGAALRELANNFPQAQYGANCVVVRAALERALPIIRTLQLYGLGDCPVISEYMENVQREVQAIIRQLLARKYTPTELSCYVGIAKLVDLGDQTATFWDAWAQVEAAAALRHP